MTLYVVVDLNGQKALLITDREADAREMAEKEKGAVLETENVLLSNGAQCMVSMAYEESCVEESVRITLRDKGVDENVDPTGFEELAASIAADAYSEMSKYGTSEDYEIDEAIKAHVEEISALLAKSEKD